MILERTPAAPTADKTLTRWPVNRITPDPHQPRKAFDERLLDELAGNVKAVGQLCPVTGYADPAAPDWLVLVDGERRLRAARRVPLEFLDAIVLPGPPSAAELVLAQLSLGQLREKLSMPEQAEAFAKLMSDLNLSQHQLAGRLGVSPTKVSNAFAVRRLVPDLQPLAAKLEPSVVPIIARLPEADQPAVATYAATPTEGGKRPGRDDVQAFIAARRPAKVVRTKAFAGELDGRKFRVELRAGDTHEALVEFLKALSALVARHKAVPVPNLTLVAGG